MCAFVFALVFLIGILQDALKEIEIYFTHYYGGAFRELAVNLRALFRAYGQHGRMPSTYFILPSLQMRGDASEQSQEHRPASLLRSTA